ncbi:hypothetical protein EW145_g6874 [Phellinidium pouzarii]|uniref:F-box domain-containing protein n=1 Tax=Phellinidium pouzarii TaxID=167371 RepID=A0A4V3XBF0_9AGAM|nr:hypothetical protein EW145_g6874 [Phellinidium pouzarii]
MERTSYAERVFYVPELLRSILSFADAHSQSRCARVCKKWSNIALDVLWRELRSPTPLISLLSPLRPGREFQVTESYPATLEFERSIRVDDWRNLEPYARRVRHLRLALLTSLSTRVFTEMAQKRPTLAILPNLTRLTVYCNTSLKHLEHSLLFMSESITELELTLPVQASWALEDGPAEFFEEVIARVPRLRVFDMKVPNSSDWSVTKIESSLTAFLSTARELKTFISPLYFATSSVITALSQLPSLGTIQFELPEEQGRGSRHDVISFAPKLSAGSFPALFDLSLTATFEDTARFFNMDFAPLHLTVLFVHSPQLETSEQLRNLLVVLSQQCQQLTRLYLDSIPFAVHGSLRDNNGVVLDKVTLLTLLPLRDFPNLTTFAISYHSPFQLDDSDVEAIVADWPTLEELDLCSDPYPLEPSRLTLRLLTILAKHCPKLRSLSLYIDTSGANKLALSLSDSSLDDSFIFPARLSYLASLNFGTSPLDHADVRGTSLYLSALLPRTCNLEQLYGITWNVGISEIHGGISLGSDLPLPFAWEEVSKAVPLLIEAREQERERTRELEKEARDLRMRVAFFEEQSRFLMVNPSGLGDMRVSVLSDCLKNIVNAEKRGKRQVLIRPSSKVIVKYLSVMQRHGYIGEFELIDDHRAGKIVVQLNGRLNKTGVISPRYNVQVTQIESWVNLLLPSRGFGKIILTTSSGILDHEEARRKNVVIRGGPGPAHLIDHVCTGTSTTQENRSLLLLFLLLKLFNLMENNNCNRVFDATELRERVFFFADDITLATCARVCSQWTKSALALLWTEMDKLEPFFAVLTPLHRIVRQENHKREVIKAMRAASVTDWYRFLEYGRRIRRFIINSPTIQEYGANVLNEITRRRPLLSLTTNLRELIIMPTDDNNVPALLDTVLLLLHETLRSLTLFVPQSPTVASTFLAHVFLRIPHLKELTIKSTLPVAVFEKAMVDMLSQLKDLRCISLPTYALTPMLISELSTIPSLETISINDDMCCVISPQIYLTSIVDELNFLSLTNLEVAATFSDLATLVTSASFKNLTALRFQAVSLENVSSLRTLLECTSDTYPELFSLIIETIPHGFSFQKYAFIELERKSMTVIHSDLQPLLSMRRLKRLFLTWPTPFSFANCELESFVSGLPLIENLSLNSCPVVIDSPSSLTLEVFPAIAKHCPKLRHLALYLNTITITDYISRIASPFDSEDDWKSYTFADLESLDLGISPMYQDAQYLATYLSKLLPVSCLVTAPDCEWFPDVREAVSQEYGSDYNQGRWSHRYKDVAAQVLPLIKARVEERNNAQARIEILKDRIRELEALLLPSSL